MKLLISASIAVFGILDILLLFNQDLIGSPKFLLIWSICAISGLCLTLTLCIPRSAHGMKRTPFVGMVGSFYGAVTLAGILLSLQPESYLLWVVITIPAAVLLATAICVFWFFYGAKLPHFLGFGTS